MELRLDQVEPGAESHTRQPFVSRSRRDLKNVGPIRKKLERRGHHPLLFFHKCLEDDDARLPALIREEIQARDWFILCDSLNVKSLAERFPLTG